MYPEYAEVNGKKYKINTDFRYAIKCNEIALDKTIGDTERALAIIYTLFGEEGLNHLEDFEQLLIMAIKYIKCGVDIEETDSNEKKEPDIDYVEDQNYISSSFKYDYNYDPYKMDYLHWYEFWNDLNNLSNSEFGNCCILNRVRNLRNFDVSEIKDKKERDKIIKAKKQVELKKNKKENNLTQEQEDSMRRLNEIVFGKE